MVFGICTYYLFVGRGKLIATMRACEPTTNKRLGMRSIVLDSVSETIMKHELLCVPVDW
jgi:hypothetical protein